MKMMPACTRPTQKPEKQQIPIVVFSFEPATARTQQYFSYIVADSFIDGGN
jgi:hypothetical protein